MLPAFLTARLALLFGITIRSHDLSRAVAVCATMSPFFQMIVSPTLALIVAGTKATLFICTVMVSARAVLAAAISAATAKTELLNAVLTSGPPRRARRAAHGPGKS